jgi:hydrogenase expression/formation protein HypC
MCLGIPGRIVAIEPGPEGFASGKVDFGGIVKVVSLAYVPEAKVGDYVIIHVGFAISVLDEAEAKETFTYLEQMDALAELGSPEKP